MSRISIAAQEKTHCRRRVVFEMARLLEERADYTNLLKGARQLERTLQLNSTRQ